MNTEIEERIQKLEEELKKLKSEVTEKENKNDNIRWRADLGGKYYSLSSCGYVIDCIDDYNNNSHKDRYNIGNYFETVEEAKHTFEMLKVKQRLKDIALRLNNGQDIDFNNSQQEKYYIVYNKPLNKLEYGVYHCRCIHGCVYCLDENFFNVAIQEIGEEKLIELIKSGV